jgi:hypothetical protein
MYDFVDLWRSAAQAGMPSLFVAQPHFWSFIRDGMLPMIGPAPSETTDGAGGVTGFTFPSSEGDYGLAQRNLPNVNGTLNRLALNGNIIVTTPFFPHFIALLCHPLPAFVLALALVRLFVRTGRLSFLFLSHKN